MNAIAQSPFASTFETEISQLKARVVEIEAEIAQGELRRKEEQIKEYEELDRRKVAEPHNTYQYVPKKQYQELQQQVQEMIEEDDDDFDDAYYSDDGEVHLSRGGRNDPSGYQYSIERNQRRRRELENDPKYLDSHCVWIGNVYEKDLSAIYDVLRPAGALVGIAFIHDTQTGKFKQCAFAQYANKADVKKAHQMKLPAPYILNFASDVKGGILKAGGLDVRNFDTLAKRPTIEQVELELAKRKKEGLVGPVLHRDWEEKKVRPCHKFQKGHCPFGEKCIYDHVKFENYRR